MTQEDIKRDPATGRSNALDLPASEYSELQTEKAFARFNSAKRPRDEKKEVRNGTRD